MAFNSNRKSGARSTQPRNDAGDEQLRSALAAHAHGAVEVVIAIASERNVAWADALNEYPNIFKEAGDALLARIARAREARK